MSEIELQRKLLGDTVRNEALHRALAKTIEPGKSRVVDIGAGTGFLSFLARRLGAAHCTLIEYADTLELAQDIARVNSIDELSFVRAHSSEVKRPAKSDIVIAEILGNYALEEGLLETLVDARRFLKPGGTLIPGRLRQFVAPVLTDRVQREIDIWPGVGFGLDLAPARAVALNNMYVKTFRSEDLGAGEELVRVWDELDFRPPAKPPSSLRRQTLHWTADALAAKPIHGFALWWEAELVEGVVLSTSPWAPATHWEQIYLPLLSPVVLAGKETVELSLTSDTRREAGLRVAWHTRHLRGGKALAEQTQDITRGRL